MTQADVLTTDPGPVRWAHLFVLWGLLGCGHSEPFGARTFDTDQPFDPTPPVRLTLNHGHDRRAAWLPDGSGILYSTQAEESREHDICLAELPSSGGRQRSLTCTLSPNGTELTEAIESAAPDADGRLAFYAATSSINALVADQQALALGTLADPATRTNLLSIPYTIPGRRTHSGLSQLRWLSPTRLLYLAEAVNLVTPCPFCMRDTLHSGLDAVWLAVDGSGGLPHPIPGTDNASGVTPGSSEDEVYYTLGGDTRIYRQLLSTGAVSTVFDFGAAGIARDVHAVGNRLAAVVGGRVHYADDPSLGPTQWDSGGIVHVVNLQDGSDVPLDDPTNLGLYRRPQLSPSGSEVVAERYPLLLIDIRDQNGSLIRVDTSVIRTADLYHFGLP